MTNESLQASKLNKPEFFQKVEGVYKQYRQDSIVPYPHIQSLDIPKMTFTAETCVIGVFGLANLNIFHLYGADAYNTIRNSITTESTNGYVGQVPGFQSQVKIDGLIKLGIKPFVIKQPLFSSGGYLNLIAYPDGKLFFYFGREIIRL